MKQILFLLLAFLLTNFYFVLSIRTNLPLLTNSSQHENRDSNMGDKKGIPISKHSGVRASLFPNVPPYIKFVLYNETVQPWPKEVKEHLTWTFERLQSRFYKRTVKSSGFRITAAEGNYRCVFKNRDHNYYKKTKPHVKLDKIPGATQLSNKAALWKNLRVSIQRHGTEVYGFAPTTFALPQEREAFKSVWNSRNCSESTCMWISKPPNMEAGIGIKVITDPEDVLSIRKPTILQEYIKPFLITGRKFDLRIFVLITNFNPLRVYLYNDGYVRFASMKFSNDSKYTNERTMHLTNRGVNKGSQNYVKNNGKSETIGSQLSLSALWTYLEREGIATKPLKSQIEDIIIKTVASGDVAVLKKAAVEHNRYMSYNLFGFDIGLDQNAKPWLYETNSSPGTGADSRFLLSLKSQILTETLNIAGFHFPPNLTDSAQEAVRKRIQSEMPLSAVTFDSRFYNGSICAESREKQKYFGKWKDSSSFVDKILVNLTPSDLRELMTAEDELSQCRNFGRIFPSSSSHRYLQYFRKQRYYNSLLAAWEMKYGKKRDVGINRLRKACTLGIHLD